eukprot:scaffold6857_cov125-Isochrysis_galbana.AAC.3
MPSRAPVPSTALLRALHDSSAMLLFIRDVALIIACATKYLYIPNYTGYEGKRLEGPCPHQSSEQLVDEDNRGHHNPPASRWALDAPGRGQAGGGQGGTGEAGWRAPFAAIF